MATQALVTFRDARLDVHIYRHKYGAPEVIATKLLQAQDKAKVEFDASEFAAAFVAVTKEALGDVRILGCGDWQKVAPADIRFRYVVSYVAQENLIYVEAYAVHFDRDSDTWYERELFSGSASDMKVWGCKEVGNG